MENTKHTGFERAFFVLCFFSIFVLESFMIYRTVMTYDPLSFAGLLGFVYLAIQLIAAGALLYFINPKNG